MQPIGRSVPMLLCPTVVTALSWAAVAWQAGHLCWGRNERSGGWETPQRNGGSEGAGCHRLWSREEQDHMPRLRAVPSWSPHPAWPSCKAVPPSQASLASALQADNPGSRCVNCERPRARGTLTIELGPHLPNEQTGGRLGSEHREALSNRYEPHKSHSSMAFVVPDWN